MTSIGKFRHLSRCTTAEGHFVIMAIDHRNNLLDKLNQHAHAPLSDDDFVSFKQQVISGLSACSSAILTDPAYGIAKAITTHTITGQMGLLAPIEVTDYGLPPGQRSMKLIPNWSVEKIKRMGGDGIKLLLPYHPADDNEEKHHLIEQIVADCAKFDIPFFLEPIPYALDPNTPLPNPELLQINIEMCQTFSRMGVDILKLPFPVDPKQSQDLSEWQAACEAVTSACSVPWALLSAGVNYETFAKQVVVACKAGASGVIVGRAVWAEAVELHGDERQNFVDTIALDRMKFLKSLCSEHADSWHNKVTLPNADLDWYEDYH
ncbi:MAG: tagatose 1,6-diphosphate aldolase [Aggregatilineales bacterium]